MGDIKEDIKHYVNKNKCSALTKEQVRELEQKHGVAFSHAHFMGPFKEVCPEGFTIPSPNGSIVMVMNKNNEVLPL